jgi:uncharacterized peroxidase-related enzyme
MFIQTVSETEAQGKVGDVYAGDREALGYVPNHAKVFSPRPDVLEAWRGFQASIRRNLPVRRYELVTMAAAQALDSRYCLLAHGAVLIKNGMTVAQLRAVLTDFHEAGLEPAEVGMMDYAQKIARSAAQITQADVDVLRSLGFEDIEILDVALTATMRCFASKTFSALGAGSDAALDGLEGELSDLLPA